MSTQSESTIKQRILITTLTLNPSTMAYCVFQDFIKHSAYYDGEMEIFHNSYKLAPTVQITFDYEDKHQDKVDEAITLVRKVLSEGNVDALSGTPFDSKDFVYTTMIDEAMDYIHELLPYGFTRYSSEFMYNPVQTNFDKWFYDLPLDTDLDKLGDMCVDKYLRLLGQYISSGRSGEVDWKPDFRGQ